MTKKHVITLADVIKDYNRRLGVNQRALETTKRDLRTRIKPGATVYTKLNHVSRSGMSRVIDVFVFKKNEPRRLSWAVAEVTGLGYDRRHEGVKVSGCGMDVGFEVVYQLSQALYGQGYTCLGKGKCPSNYHTNYRDFTYCACEENAGVRLTENGEECTSCRDGKIEAPPERYNLIHTDGYALRHRRL